MSGAGFQGGLTTQSRSLKLIVKTLCPGFLVSIVNGAAPILAMFKRNLETSGFITFGLDPEKVEVEAGVICGGSDSDSPNPEIVTGLDFDEQWD